jgi:hypothetical protein
MPHAEPGWPNFTCSGQTAQNRLKAIIQQALNANPPEWMTVYLAAHCGLNHTIPVVPQADPGKTACQYVMDAQAAIPTWATVMKELNHAGGQPQQLGQPSGGQRIELHVTGDLNVRMT